MSVEDPAQEAVASVEQLGEDASPEMEPTASSTAASSTSAATSSTGTDASSDPSQHSHILSADPMWASLTEMEADASFEQQRRPTSSPPATSNSGSGGGGAGVAVQVTFDQLKSSLEDASQEHALRERAGADHLTMRSLNFASSAAKLRDVASSATNGQLTSTAISAAFMKNLDEAEKFTFVSHAKHGKAGKAGRQKQNMRRGANRRKKKGAMRGAGYADKMAMRLSLIHI